MAEKVFGFKVSEDLHDKVKAMIEASGDNNKVWFEKAVALAEMNSIKQGSSDYKKDLTELEVHTTRIYELVSGMIQQSIFLKDQATRQLTEKLDQRDATISEYQAKAKAAVEAHKVAVDQLKESTEELERQEKTINELRGTNDNNQALISEYKEKIDTLSGLVSKYQGFADENEELKKEFEAKESRMSSAIAELNTTVRQQAEMIEKLQNEIETTKVNNDNRLTRLTDKHKDDLERISEKKETEKERALLAMEREYQAKLSKSNEDHLAKIESMYGDINDLRKALQEAQQPKK